jgi:serine/threonine protein kinase
MSKNILNFGFKTCRPIRLKAPHCPSWSFVALKLDGHAFILLAVAMKSVLGAVQTMHATGMTHRDIKPDNIMMTTNLDQGGFVHQLMNTGKKAIAILIDFGLATFPGVYYVQPQHFPKFISKPMESVPEERRGLSANTDTSRASSIAMNAQNQSGSKTISKDQGEKGVITGGPIEIGVCSLNRVSACLPSVTGGDAPPSVTGGDAPPKERLDTYGTTAFGPQRETPKLGQGCIIVQVETGGQVIFGRWG